MSLNDCIGKTLKLWPILVDHYITWLNPHVYLDTVFMIGSLSMPYSGVEKWKFAMGALSASVVWFVAITYGAKVLLPLFRNPHAWRVLDAVVAMMMGYLSVSLLITPLP
ncbi:MAG: LysE/ArgO family amino acid transporter [Vibrio sp.]